MIHIRVEGLDDLRRGLRSIDNKLGKELGQRNKEVGQFVVSEADRRRRRMASKFPSYGASVLKVKPSANQRRGQVTITPAAAEWGTTRHPVFGRDMPQTRFKRKVWPAPNSGGWMVYPTVVEKEKEIADLYLDAVMTLVRKVLGPDI